MKKFLMCALLLTSVAVLKGQAQPHHISDSPSDPNFQYFVGNWGDLGFTNNGHEVYRTLGEVNSALPAGVTVTDYGAPSLL